MVMIVVYFFDALFFIPDGMDTGLVILSYLAWKRPLKSRCGSMVMGVWQLGTMVRAMPPVAMILGACDMDEASQTSAACQASSERLQSP